MYNSLKNLIFGVLYVIAFATLSPAYADNSVAYQGSYNDGNYGTYRHSGPDNYRKQFEPLNQGFVASQNFFTPPLQNLPRYQSYSNNYYGPRNHHHRNYNSYPPRVINNYYMPGYYNAYPNTYYYDAPPEYYYDNNPYNRSYYYYYYGN